MAGQFGDAITGHRNYDLQRDGYFTGMDIVDCRWKTLALRISSWIMSVTYSLAGQGS